MNILIVGQQPAPKGDASRPFVGTASGKRLDRWLAKAVINDYYIINVSNSKRRLTQKMLEAAAKSVQLNVQLFLADRVIALGAIAQGAIELSYARTSLKKILHLPHPSGLNRQLNKPGSEAQIVRQLKEFVACE